MGKDLKGKEIGEGVSQKPNGKYLARFRSKTGKRPEKQFDKVSEAKRWLAEQKVREMHGQFVRSNSLTVNEWFHTWMQDVMIHHLREHTYSSYNTRYKCDIQDIIGDLPLSKVKPIHCQQVLNRLQTIGHLSCIRATRTLMFQIFNAAIDNGLIDSSPMNKNVNVQKVVPKERRVLTAAEQDLFVAYLADHPSSVYDAFRFVLETGLRGGELAGLQWDNVDFKKKLLTVDHQIYYDQSNNVVVRPVKTRAGERIIPLTNTAIQLLQRQMDSRAPDLQYASYCFLNTHNKPLRQQNYNRSLGAICRRIGIPSISMHVLRHSFATRCIERGLRPKTLQKILGHSSIQTTMNLYVHNTDESLIEEMALFESGGRLMGGLPTESTHETA